MAAKVISGQSKNENSWWQPVTSPLLPCLFKWLVQPAAMDMVPCRKEGKGRCHPPRHALPPICQVPPEGLRFNRKLGVTQGPLELLPIRAANIDID